MKFSLRHREARAFTLIELLVSMAVVAAIMVLVLNMSSGTVNMASRTETKVGTMSTLRTALDRMTYDLHSALAREDLPPDFEPGGADGFAISSYVPGYGGERQISRVAYRVRNGGLERGVEGLAWDSASPPFSPTVVEEIATENFDLLAPGVFRMAVGFYLTDGSYRLDPPPDSWAEVRALVICLAMVSAEAITQVGWTPADTAQLAPLFPLDDPQASPLVQWSAIAGNAEALTNQGIPLPIAAGIEIQQRVIPIR